LLSRVVHQGSHRCTSNGCAQISAGAQVVSLAGRPLREPVGSHGPFIMNNEQQIASAIERYRAGGMGRLESLT